MLAQGRRGAKCFKQRDYRAEGPKVEAVCKISKLEIRTVGNRSEQMRASAVYGEAREVSKCQAVRGLWAMAGGMHLTLRVGSFIRVCKQDSDLIHGFQ